ncbi:hypothetical protein Ancab_015228 [Ancistrocladus abbreviatus]
MGFIELAAVRVSMSCLIWSQNLLNVPLLNPATSFVAEDQALISAKDSGSLEISKRTSSSCNIRVSELLICIIHSALFN